MSARGDILRAQIEQAIFWTGRGRKHRTERHAWLYNLWGMQERARRSKEILGDKYILRGGSADKWIRDWDRDSAAGEVQPPARVRA